MTGAVHVGRQTPLCSELRRSRLTLSFPRKRESTFRDVSPPRGPGFLLAWGGLRPQPKCSMEERTDRSGIRRPDAPGAKRRCASGRCFARPQASASLAFTPEAATRRTPLARPFRACLPSIGGDVPISTYRARCARLASNACQKNKMSRLCSAGMTEPRRLLAANSGHERPFRRPNQSLRNSSILGSCALPPNA